MIAIEDIRSLTDFQRNAKTYAKHLNKTGRPMVLTVNGKPGFVVQDAESYQELTDRLDHFRELQELREAIAQGERGEGIPAEEAFEAIRIKHGFSRRTDSKSVKRH
ncbi:MAG: type II toxin-antitoxin system Phd/YefM family antitoxin [Planctomycetota bacterium]